MTRKTANPATRGGLWRPAVIVTLLAASAGAVVFSGPISRALGGDGGDWVANALASRLFIACAGMMLFSALLLSVVLVAMWRMGLSQRKSGPMGSQDGATILEFAMVLPMALMLGLVLAQSSMLMGGNLCVQYAAYCGARSAIVNVPRPLPGEPSNQVSADADFGKLARIKAAAVWAVLPVAADAVEIPAGDAADLQQGLQDFFRSYGMDPPAWTGAKLARRLGYAQQYTKVELSPPAQNDTYAAHEDLQVKVTHDFYLSVPYGAAIVALVDGVDLPFGTGERATRIVAYCRLPNEGVQDYVDTERFGAGATP